MILFSRLVLKVDKRLVHAAWYLVLGLLVLATVFGALPVIIA